MLVFFVFFNLACKRVKNVENRVKSVHFAVIGLCSPQYLRPLKTKIIFELGRCFRIDSYILFDGNRPRNAEVVLLVPEFHYRHLIHSVIYMLVPN